MSAEARIFLLVNLKELFFRFRVGGTKIFFFFKISPEKTVKLVRQTYGSPGGTFLLITYHLSLITYYLLLITYYLSLITYYLLLII